MQFLNFQEPKVEVKILKYMFFYPYGMKEIGYSIEQQSFLTRTESTAGLTLSLSPQKYVSRELNMRVKYGILRFFRFAYCAAGKVYENGIGKLAGFCRSDGRCELRRCIGRISDDETSTGSEGVVCVCNRQLGRNS